MRSWCIRTWFIETGSRNSQSSSLHPALFYLCCLLRHSSRLDLELSKVMRLILSMEIAKSYHVWPSLVHKVLRLKGTLGTARRYHSITSMVLIECTKGPQVNHTDIAWLISNWTAGGELQSTIEKEIFLQHSSNPQLADTRSFCFHAFIRSIHSSSQNNPSKCVCSSLR